MLNIETNRLSSLLAENACISEEEASLFLESFSSYVGYFLAFCRFCLCQNTKVRLSERKTKLYLSFSEREYLRIRDAEVRLSERNTKKSRFFAHPGNEVILSVV